MQVAYTAWKRLLWYTTRSRFFLIVGFVNFRIFLTEIISGLWDGLGVGCHGNVEQPNPRQNVLAGGPRAHQYTLAQPTCRRREHQGVPGLPVEDGATSCNNCGHTRPQLIATDVAAGKTFFEHLYLVLGLRKFVP